MRLVGGGGDPKVKRLSRLAPEEIVGGLLFVLVLAFVAAQPRAVTRLFETPYATPAPGGGPAYSLLPSAGSPSPSPADVTIDRIGVMPLPGASRSPGFGPLPIAPVRCSGGYVLQTLGDGRTVAVCVAPTPRPASRP